MENQPSKRKLQAEKTAKLVLEYLQQVYNSTHNEEKHVIKSADIKSDIFPLDKTSAVKEGIIKTKKVGDIWLTHYVSTILPNIHMARKIVESRKKSINNTKESAVTHRGLTSELKKQSDIRVQEEKLSSFKNLKEDILKIKTNYEEQFGVKIDISISLSQHITL